MENMEDKKVRINDYWFMKHEGTLSITPHYDNECRVLRREYEDAYWDNNITEEWSDGEDGFIYFVEYYPVDTNDDIIDVLSIAVQNKLKMNLTLEEYIKLCELAIGEKGIYKKLEEVNLRKTQFLALDCKIKNINPPKVESSFNPNGGKYVQYVEVYDNNTSKTIKTLFLDKCAEFDTWKNGDHVHLIGKYSPGKYRNGTIQLIVSDAVKIEESNEPSTVTREEEIAGYDKWRDTILSQDNQKCTCCGLDKHLEAHHLYGYKEHPELATDEGNGVTLCQFCHKKYHSIYGLKNINPRDFVDFIRRFGV